MKPNPKRGSALLLATILLFVILSMVTTLTYVTVMEQKMSGKTKSSVGSFFKADSGIEWALNKIAYSTASTVGTVFSGDTFASSGKLTNSSLSGFEVYLLDKDGKIITNSSLGIDKVKAVRAVGSDDNGTERAIEAAVADGEEGLYEITCVLPGGGETICYKMRTDNGQVLSCKHKLNGPDNWTNCTALPPFPAGTSRNVGLYKLSCAGVTCVRTKTDSVQSDCVYTTQATDPASWFSCPSY